MIIVTGSGNSRDSFDIGSKFSRSRESSEKVGWELKKLLHSRGVIPSLSGKKSQATAADRGKKR